MVCLAGRLAERDLAHCHQVAVTSHFRNNGHQTYWGHDLDLSGSRDVIGHVTIGLGVGHFLLVYFGTLDRSLYLQRFPRYSAPKIMCL